MTTRRYILQLLALLAGTHCMGLAMSTRVLAQPPVAGKRVALLVGINKYQNPQFEALDYCERNVTEVATAVKSLGFDQIEVLLGSAKGEQQATKENIERTLTKLVKTLGKDDLIIVMLGGHGQQFVPSLTRRSEGFDESRKEEIYYCPLNAVSWSPDTLVSLDRMINEILAPNVGKRLVLVDSGRDVRRKQTRHENCYGERFLNLTQGTGVLFSCRVGEQSVSDPEMKRSLFSVCLLEALSGAATTGDYVRWSDVVYHVKKRMDSDEMRQRLPLGIRQSPEYCGDVDDSVLGRKHGSR